MKFIYAFLLLILACVLMYIVSPEPTLQQQHTWALKRHQYITDQEQYGIPNKWVASLKGDCEDYALVMKNKVGGKMLYVRTVGGEAHIVLDVNGYIVDNLSPVIYPRQKMQHKFIYTVTEKEIERWLSKSKSNTPLMLSGLD